MLKWIALPALAVTLMVAAAPVAYAASGYSTGNVNMRTGPGTRYARVTTIPAGAPVEIYGCQRNWCDTYFAGRRGWVSGSYLVTRGRPSVSSGAAADRYDGYDRRRYYGHRHYYPRRHYRPRHYRHYGRVGHYKYRHYGRSPWRGGGHYGGRGYGR